MLKHLRLLPAVMALGTLLLGVKAVGLVREAQAQTPAAAVHTAGLQAVSVSKTVPDDDSESSSSEVDVLTSLSKRRNELDVRQRELNTQQDLIVAAEKRVDDKIASLKSLQAQIQALLTQRDASQQKQVDSLVKTYSAMKPRDTARIFNNLEDNVLVPVAGQMKPDVLAPVLALMQAEAAQKLTVKLADRLKLPEPPPPQPPAPPQALQAALTPPAATAALGTTPPATAAATPAPSAGQTAAPASPAATGK
jgi:flagellar motility protein MotE (MotC chaperone)